MKTKNRLAKTLAAATFAVVLVATAVIWNVTRVKAFTLIKERTHSFGLISLGPGQTARINVVNSNLPGQGGVQPGPCRPGDASCRNVTLGFDTYVIGARGLDATAVDVSPGPCVTRQFLARQSCEAMIGPGQSASFDYTVPNDGTTTQIVPAVQSELIGLLRDADLVYSVEVREGDRTIFTVEPHVAIAR